MTARRERWMPLARYGGRYEMSPGGLVRSVRVLARQEHPDGYPQVTLRDADGQQHIEAIHRLVMEAFEGPPPPGPDGRPMEVLHRNGKPGDVRLRNLRYGTKPENRADREEHRRKRAGRGRNEQERKQRETGEIGGTGFLPDNSGETVSRVVS